MRGLLRQARPCGRAVTTGQVRKATTLEFQTSGGAASAESEEQASTTGSDARLEQEKPRHSLYGSILRSGLAAEAATSQLYAGQRAAGCSQPDVQLFKERSDALLQKVKKVAPTYRTRPSLFAPASSAAAFSLGAVSAALPQNLRNAVSGALQEAIAEQYNDHLRELREAGLAEEASQLREVLRDLRDEERAPEGGVKAPDLMKMQRPQELSLEEGVAGVVKYGFKAAFSAASKL